jgi:hypothetical protein
MHPISHRKFSVFWTDQWPVRTIFGLVMQFIYTVYWFLRRIRWEHKETLMLDWIATVVELGWEQLVQDLSSRYIKVKTYCNSCLPPVRAFSPTYALHGNFHCNSWSHELAINCSTVHHCKKCNATKIMKIKMYLYVYSPHFLYNAF